MNTTADISAARLEPFTKPLCARCAKEPALLTVDAANGGHDAVCALCAWTEVPCELYRWVPGASPDGLAAGLYSPHSEKVTSSRFRLAGKHQLRDEKGRDIGGVASITRPEDHGYNRYNTANERTKYEGKWMLDVHATRNGKTFGASQRGTFHATLDDAKRAGVKLLKAQRDRYAKKLGVSL